MRVCCAGRLSQSLVSPLAGSCSFLLAAAEPSGPGVGSPGAAHCPPGTKEHVCCQGITTQRKGKAASLFFLLQTLSHFSGWEQQSPAQLKAMSFCYWPHASECETKQDTITQDPFPADPGWCAGPLGGIGREGLAVELKYGKAVKQIFFKYFSRKGSLLPLPRQVLVCRSSATSVTLLLTGMG